MIPIKDKYNKLLHWIRKANENKNVYIKGFETRGKMEE